MRTLLAPQPLFPSSVYHSASKLPVPPSSNLPPFLSLFRLFRPLSLSLSLLVYIAACPTPLAPSLRTLPPPLPTLVPDVDPFRPDPVSLRSSSFSNSPRWHHRPLCSSLDAEERLNANHRAATGPWLFCLPREV